jgi:pimeloyl-ACP methyl ester carboxylesterase
VTTLLLIHAFPLDASMWDAQVKALGGEAELLSPHLPGFGGTAPLGEVLTMDAAADHCATELDRTGVDRAVVCGLSIGGYIAFSMWRRHRDRIAGLLLANTKAEPDDDAARERRRAVAEKARNGGSEAIAAEPPPLLAADADESMWERVRAIIRRQSGEAIAAASLGMAERPDSRPILPEIDVPTTVVASDGDQLIPADVTAAVADAVPGAELVRLEGAGHLSNLEHAEGFNRALRDLLARAE